MKIDAGEIDRVARAFCENLGFSPDDQISLSLEASMTELEYDEKVKGKSLTEVMRTADMFGPRWKSYRRRASEALAMKAALGL